MLLLLFQNGATFSYNHPNCSFIELETTFYKRYWIVQNDDQFYMVVRVVKQGSNEKVDIYYKIKDPQAY
jgi:hypothetical protein